MVEHSVLLFCISHGPSTCIVSQWPQWTLMNNYGQYRFATDIIKCIKQYVNMYYCYGYSAILLNEIMTRIVSFILCLSFICRHGLARFYKGDHLLIATKDLLYVFSIVSRLIKLHIREVYVICKLLFECHFLLVVSKVFLQWFNTIDIKVI